MIITLKPERDSMEDKVATDINKDEKLILRIMTHLANSREFTNDDLIGLCIGNYRIKSQISVKIK